MSKKEYEFVSGKKRRIWIWFIIVLVLACAIAAVIWYFGSKKEQTMPAENRMPTNSGFSFSEDVISATGLTQVGMAAQEWEIDFLTEGLEVEEAYLHSGEAVEAGMPVFKVTQESYDIAKEELELALKEAELNLREGYITYETGKIDAQSTYDLSLVDAEYAKNTYDSAVLSAKESLELAQEEVESARELVEEYTASIETNYYYTYYEVKEIQNEWYEYAEIVQELYKRWNVEELEKNYTKSSRMNGSSADGMMSGTDGAMSGNSQEASGAQGSGSMPQGGSGSMPEGGMPEGGMPGGGSGSVPNIPMSKSSAKTSGLVSLSTSKSTGVSMGQNSALVSLNTGSVMAMANFRGQNAGGGNSQDEQSKYDVYCMYEEKSAEKKQEYEEAVELYETARDKALAGIAQAQSKLAMAEAELLQQQSTYDNAVLSAQTTYDAALSEKENAQMVYESSMELLEEEYEALVDAQKEAQGNLDLLVETIGDLCYYTEKAGTVMMNNVRTGDVLTQATIVFAYQDTETVTVSASVDQDNIASLSIGEEAVIYVSGYSMMTGTITAIDPVSDSQRSSNVTYSVTVTVSEAAEGLEGNMTAYVYFGLTEEEKSMMGSAMGGMR